MMYNLIAKTKYTYEYNIFFPFPYYIVLLIVTSVQLLNNDINYNRLKYLFLFLGRIIFSIVFFLSFILL